MLVGRLGGKASIWGEATAPPPLSQCNYVPGLNDVILLRDCLEFDVFEH